MKNIGAFLLTIFFIVFISSTYCLVLNPSIIFVISLLLLLFCLFLTYNSDPGYINNEKVKIIDEK
jgi:hypothetical protein